MDRRQYLMATGTVLSTGLAGCLGGGSSEDSGPQKPFIAELNIQTSPRVRVSPQVRNPTDERIKRRLWVRVASKDGGTLATRSKIVTLNPTGDGAPASIPFFFTNVAWSGTEVDTENTEAVLTATDAGSPFN
ncbi:MAG: hypothetical protein ABEH61_02155 [Haloarculaceae archaeon]